ncbi:MAG TPA: CocE/NonD family hydrolase [Aliidongia sp.]|uniref:CocE/NonD family hydrolase n=1 Tax=Aliidongia sp. TaxID=1914230 RepID=UPI002DDD6B63|nr:CocE/NonD family hydrolase [Aliidongia sp.]HEV2675674.1 CocE/NonD family hydrolase [Aliidongia sp.]
MTQPFDVLVERDIPVAMRDGIVLVLDIHRPARDGTVAEGAFPVVLERTPYDKSAPSRSELDRGQDRPLGRAEVAAEFVGYGYVVVYQDCRGRHGSGGRFTKYLSEGEDGFDTIAWIARQPWCDGRVATMGLSYAAHTQAALACLAPPALAAMVLDCGGFSNAYRCGIRQGGAFELKQATWAFNQAKESPEALADPLVLAALEAEDLRMWFAAMPWRPGHSPVRWVPEYEAYLFEQWTHGTFDDFWRRLGIYAEGFYDQFADVPQVHMSSWYDAYVPTAIGNYSALKARKKSAVRLIMGPWLHGDRTLSHAGDVEFGPAAPIDGNVAPNWRVFRRRWYDHWLKGIDNGVDREPSVRLFLMGGGTGRRTAEGRIDHGGRWIAAEDWPLPDTRFTPYHLHADGRLDPALPGEGDPLAYQFDPAHPVPTIGGALTSGMPVFAGGAFDQREADLFFGCTRPGLPLAARADVLVFETAPLAADMAVIGPITVRLFVSSDAPDTDFTAKLIDVHPPTPDDPRGFAMNLTDGILRCRYRDSFEAPSMMAPGRVYEITIEPFATANLFQRGHRIRLDISSSNFPKYDVNPNTGEPEGAARLKRIATNRVHLDPAHPSHVLLPIVPVEALRDL